MTFYYITARPALLPPSLQILRPSDVFLEAMEDAKRQFAAKARRCQQVAFCIVNTNYYLL